MVCSLPGTSVHGIFQAEILEWLPPPGFGPNLGIKPVSPELAGEYFFFFFHLFLLVGG